MSPSTSSVATASFLLLFLGGASVAGSEPPPSAAPAPRVSVTPRRGLEGRDVALLVSGQEGGQIVVSIQAFPVESAGRPNRVPWVADLPGFTLLSMADGDALDLELAVYLQRANGEIVGHEQDVLHITGIPASWQAGGGIKLLGYVDASAPPSVLRLLVREPASGAFGNWEMPVPERAGVTGGGTDVGFAPGPATAGPAGVGPTSQGFEGKMGRSALPSIVVPEPAGAWTAVGLGGASPDAKQPPFSLAGAGSLPATRPVLRPGSVLRATLLGESLPGGLEALGRVFYSDGRRPETCSARIMSRLPAPAGPFERLEVAVTLPPGIGPGEHVLAVSCRPDGGLDAGAVTIHFRVARPERAAGALTWPAVPIDVTGKPVEMAKPNVGTVPSEEEAPAELKAGYRDAVAAVAAGGSPESLAAFERAALAGGSSGDLGRLASAERALAKSLAGVSPQALLGLCLVQLDVYREHSRQSAYLAIGHSRRVIEETVEMLAASAKDPAGKRSAADVLTAFAAELQAVGSSPSAERLFVRATAFEPDEVAALMGRACILERLGDIRHAAEVLEQVLARHPGHAEAELRLGVNLRRLGRTDAARKALTASTAEGRPAWIRAVAWQELASAELAADRPDEALRILRSAAAAAPDDEGLQVMLASTLDRARRHREALAVVDSVVSRRRDPGPSARLIYAQPPQDDMDALLRRLDEQRASSLAALAAAGKGGAS